jgi:hypothetical protein
MTTPIHPDMLDVTEPSIHELAWMAATGRTPARRRSGVIAAACFLAAGTIALAALLLLAVTIGGSR